jgi:ADP-heptose:LPS heptosyltransferase
MNNSRLGTRIVFLGLTLFGGGILALGGESPPAAAKPFLDHYRETVGQDPKRIVCVSSISYLGDMIIKFLPLVEMVRRQFPNASLEVYSPFKRSFGGDFKGFSAHLVPKDEIRAMAVAQELGSDATADQFGEALVDRVVEEVGDRPDLLVLDVSSNFGLSDIANSDSGNLSEQVKERLRSSGSELLVNGLKKRRINHLLIDTSLGVTLNVQSRPGKFRERRFTHRSNKDNIYEDVGEFVNNFSGLPYEEIFQKLNQYFLPQHEQGQLAQLKKFGLEKDQYILFNFQTGKPDSVAPLTVEDLIAIVRGLRKALVNIRVKIAVAYWNEFDIKDFLGAELEEVQHLKTLLTEGLKGVVQLPSFTEAPGLHEIAIRWSKGVVSLDTGLAHVAHVLAPGKTLTIFNDHKTHPRWRHPTGATHVMDIYSKGVAVPLLQRTVGFLQKTTQLKLVDPSCKPSTPPSAK